MNELRPTLLKDIVGQDAVRQRMRIIVDAALQRKVALDHCLLDGPPGLGKTTFSTALQNELGVDIQIANGANLRSIKSLLPYIMRVKERSILFIDEIHRCPTLVQEFLYPIMEDYRCDLGKDSYMVIDLPRFTLIGATTNAGLLSAPLSGRFQHKFHLELYDNSSLQGIIIGNVLKLKIPMTQAACMLVAKVSRGTPRVANNYLAWLRDYALAHHCTTVDTKVVTSALQMIGVDIDGLDVNDRKYLEVLKKSVEPMGVKTISSMSNIDIDTIINNIEPFLIRLGKVKKTPRGRVAL